MTGFKLSFPDRTRPLGPSHRLHVRVRGHARDLARDRSRGRVHVRVHRDSNDPDLDHDPSDARVLLGLALRPSNPRNIFHPRSAVGPNRLLHKGASSSNPHATCNDGRPDTSTLRPTHSWAPGAAVQRTLEAVVALRSRFQSKPAPEPLKRSKRSSRPRVPLSRFSFPPPVTMQEL
jgi:hypothetical protein